MTASRWRVAIVGCGRIAGGEDHPRREGPVVTHALAYYRHPDFTLEAAVDTDPHRLKSFQDAWGVPRGYPKLTDMLSNESVDVISLCVPNQYHAAQLLEIIGSSCAARVIFVEKPVCLHRAELEKILAAANDSKYLIMVNHTRRFDPGHIRLMELVQSQALGAFIQGRCDYYGGWMNNGCHLIDTLRMLFQREPIIESVRPGAPGRPDDPCLDLRLLIGDAPVDIHSFDEKYFQLYEGEFRFESGRVLLRNFGAEIAVEKVNTEDRRERVLAPFPDSPWKGLESPLSHAVELIGQYLDKETSLTGRGILINEAAGTMDVLWKALEKLRIGGCK